MVQFKKGALVVWRGKVVPIANRWTYPDGTLYLINSKHPQHGLVSDMNITFGQLVAEMNSYARFCVGDKVELGPWERYIKARWWNCRRGTVVYRINDLKDDRSASVILPQEELIARLDGHAGNSV